MKKIFFYYLPLLLSVGILCLTVVICSYFPEKAIQEQNEEGEESEESIVLPSAAETGGHKTVQDEEMMAVWVPFMTLDSGGKERSREEYTAFIREIMSKIRSVNANTVIFHTRPFCDALYPSELFPFSHILTGTQGKKVSYDPLKIAIDEAHRAGLKFHSWINPLRVKYNTMPSSFSDSSPYMKWKNSPDKTDDRYTFSCGSGIYLDPAIPEVRRLIIDGVREIVRNYDVDGVQIDDYFYPENMNNADSTEYKAYCEKAGENYLSLEEWRTENINKLVSGLYDAVHEKQGCVFGISPQGNTDNDLKLGADVFRWCSEKGYADYICPQIYVSEAHPVMPFRECADKWRKMVTNKDMKLYFGLALYKVGTDSDNGTWLLKKDNIQSEINYGRSIGGGGFMLFAYDDLFRGEKWK